MLLEHLDGYEAAQCIAAGLKFNCGGKTEVTNVDNIRFLQAVIQIGFRCGR